MYIYLLKTKKNIWPYWRNEFDHLWFLSPKSQVIHEIKIDDIGTLFKNLKSLNIRVTVQNKQIKKILSEAYEPFWKEWDVIFPTIEEFKEHMHDNHGKLICSLCQGDEGIVTELYFYDSLKKLRKHQAETIQGQTRHPLWNFWNRIFENNGKYMKHVKEEHFYWNLCHQNSKKYIFGSLKSYNDHIIKYHEDDLKQRKLDLTSIIKKQLCKNYLLKTQIASATLDKFYKDLIETNNT